MKVFLGGTVNGSMWRNQIIPKLKIDYFNPQVDVNEWTPAFIEKENEEKKTSDYLLYFITPRMKGVYAIAELVESAILHPEKTIFIYIQADVSGGEIRTFDEQQIKSLNAVGMLISSHGAIWCRTVDELIEYLNK